MPSVLLEYRLRIRNAPDSADLVTISSVVGDTAPYIKEPPRGDGSRLDPITGVVIAGSYSVLVVDAITSGTTRVLTSLYEDARGLPNLAGLRAFVEFRVDGGSWSQLSNGVITSVRDVDDITREIAVSEPMRIEHEVMAFTPKVGTIFLTANASNGATSLSVAAIPFDLLNGTVLYFSISLKAVLSAAASSGATTLSVSALAASIDAGMGAPAVEPIASWLNRWPNRGCILGGPVRGGFLNQPDLGGWEMNIEESDGSKRWLKFKAGYSAPGFGRTTDPLAIIPAVNTRTDPRWVGDEGTPFDELTFSDQPPLQLGWKNVIVEIIGVGFFMAEPTMTFNGRLVGHDGRYRQIAKADIKPGIFIRANGLSTGATIRRVRVFTQDASELSPIYWTGHPVDLATKLLGDAGIAYDTTTATSTKQAVGSSRVISIRITEPKELGTFLEQSVYGPHGIGTRVNSSGAIEFFTTRIMVTAVPGTTLTDADVQTGTTRAYSLDATAAIRKVVLTLKQLVRSQDLAGISNVNSANFSGGLDGFVTQDVRIERLNPDGQVVGKNEISFDIPGMIHQTDGKMNAPQFVDAMALEIFNRRGRGDVKAETTTIRGGAGDNLKLGDEILVALLQIANHNKRRLDDAGTAVARAMQVIGITETPSGKQLELLDSGPNANAVATTPTYTIAKSGDRPRTVTELTITNAGTLNAVPAGIRVRMAVTDSGSTPASTDYADVLAYPAGQVPTTAIRLPSVKAGQKVFAIVRSEGPGARPSAYGSAQSVVTDALDPVNTLVAATVTSNGHLEDLSWVVGSNAGDAEILVFLRLDGAPSSDAVLQVILAPGSTRFRLDGMTPNTAYTAGVQARDSITGDVSTTVETTFTTANSTHTIPPFGFPIPLSGPLGPNPFFRNRTIPTIGFGGTTTSGVESSTIYQYGMAFLSSEPCEFEIQEAIETAVSSGSYSSFETIARGLTLQGAFTEWWGTAPGNGRRRKLKARGVREGATASSYTAEVIITPGTPQPFRYPGKRYSFSAIGMLADVDNSATSVLDRNSGYLKGSALATNNVGVMEVHLPDGFSVTAFESVSYRQTGSDAVSITFYRVARSGHAKTAMASQSNSTTGADEVITSTGLGHTVDGTAFSYYVEGLLNPNAANNNARLYEFTVIGDQSDVIQS